MHFFLQQQQLLPKTAEYWLNSTSTIVFLSLCSVINEEQVHDILTK